MADLTPIWEGRPGRTVCFGGQAAVIAALGSLWFLASALFTGVTWATRSPLVVPGLGAVFAAFGAGLMLLPVWDAIRRSRTRYRLSATGLEVAGPLGRRWHGATALGSVRVVRHGDGTSTLWTRASPRGGVPLVERVDDGARVAALFDRVHLAADDRAGRAAT